MLLSSKILKGNARGKSVNSYLLMNINDLDATAVISNMSVTLKHWSVTQDEHFPLTDL